MARKLFTHKCDYCSATFQRNKEKTEGSRTFCSTEHARLGQNKNSGVPYSKSKKYPAEASCCVCLKTFTAKSPQTVYCSEPCRHTARNVRVKERWKNRKVIGITFDKGTKHAAKASLLENVKECPICKISFTKMDVKNIHLDHDHSTGKVRGVLCFSCNAGLGQFRDSVDNLRSAIEYLNNNNKERSV